MPMRLQNNTDAAAAAPPPELADKAMHARLEIGGGVVLLSDGHGLQGPQFQGLALTVTVADAAETDKIFAALSGGGRVVWSLKKAFFSERFGMAQDPFGAPWIVYVG